MNETTLSDSLPPLRLLLLGYGHVAQALLPLLASRSVWLRHNLGIRPLFTGIGSRSQGLYIHDEGVEAAVLSYEQDPLRRFQGEGQRLRDVETFIQAGKAAGASVLIELTTLNPQNGQPALDHIRSALRAGMDVATANKGPVAYAGRELEEIARRQGVQFRFESTVMDGLPIFNLAQFTLPAVGMRSFRALLNTTSTIVLSMIKHGFSLEDAILKAQQLGVAEANPWHDLDGWDAVMKTTILANMLLDGQLTPGMVEREGIRELTPGDIRSAALAGTPIRLVSSAHWESGVLTAEVRPRKISTDDILRAGKETSSVIALETEAMGTITLIEHESTTMQTAYGVFSDLVTILQRRREASIYTS